VYILLPLLLPPTRLYFTQRLSVCLSVCLQLVRKNYESDLPDNFTGDVSVDMERLIKCWKSQESGSGPDRFS